MIRLRHAWAFVLAVKDSVPQLVRQARVIVDTNYRRRRLDVWAP